MAADVHDGKAVHGHAAIALDPSAEIRGVNQSFWLRPYKIPNTGRILIQLGSFERRELTELEMKGCVKNQQFFRFF